MKEFINVFFFGFSPWLFPQYAAREAEIVAQAGRKYAITISTNMAGRGTDIILGGNPKVGVHVRCSISFFISLRKYVS